jgi:hypothetical protein
MKGNSEQLTSKADYKIGAGLVDDAALVVSVVTSGYSL